MLDSRVERRQHVRNALHGVLLLGCLLAMAGALEWLLFGPVALAWLAGVGGLLLLVRPRIRVGRLLSAIGAVPLPPSVVPGLHGAVRELSRRARLSRSPRLWFIPDEVPEAFTVGGRADPAMVLSDGLLTQLTPREVLGVLAHEVSHLRAGDHAILRLSTAVARFTLALAYLGLLALLTGLHQPVRGTAAFVGVAALLLVLPFVVIGLQLALSRTREFDADLGAARLTGDPEALARALERVELICGRSWQVWPARGRRPREPWLLHTHPATSDRTRRLRRLEPVPDRDPWSVVRWGS